MISFKAITILSAIASTLSYGVKEDSKKAVYWLECASENNCEGAMNLFASICDETSDKEKALKWFRKAAELNDAESQAYLGKYYLYGEVKKSFFM